MSGANFNDTTKPVATNPTSDNTQLVIGTTKPFGLTAQVSGLAFPYSVLTTPDHNPLVLSTQTNKAFDFFGTDVSGFINSPWILFTGQTQVKNNAMAVGMDALGVGSTTFGIEAVSGDLIGGTAENSNGVSVDLTAGDAGTLGGVGGAVTVNAGRPLSGTTNGADITLGPSNGNSGGKTGLLQLINQDGHGAGMVMYTPSATPSLSAANTGVMYYDQAFQHFRMSENGGAFSPVLGARAPAGSAGGALAGTYPNPTLALTTAAFTNLSIKHIIGTSTTPGVAANSGSGGTASISGTDIAGLVSTTTGVAPTAAAAILTVTFNAAYGSSPYVVLTPANAATALLSGTSMVYITSSTTTFVINAGSVALVGVTSYSWNYQVIG